MASKKGYLPPVVIDPPTRRCVTIFIPDDVWWASAFWGQLTDLSNPWLWEATPEQREEITEVWNGVLATARQNWDDGECTLPLEFRVVGGIVEYRPDPAATWTAIGEACACQQVTPSPEYNPDTGTFEQRACNIAVGLIDWIMEKFNDAIDTIEAQVDVIASFDLIFAAMMPVYLGADALLDAVQEVIEATAGVARAFDAESRREEMKRFLYCEMYATGEMTEVIWSDFLAWAESEYNTGLLAAGWLAWDYWAKAFDTSSIISRARIVSYELSDCIEFSCGFDWEHETIFDDGTFKDWNVFGGRAMTATSTGIEAGLTENAGQTRLQVTLYNNMPFRDNTTIIAEMYTEYGGADEGDSDAGGADPSFGNMRVFSAQNGTGSIILNSGTLDISGTSGSMNSNGHAFSVPADASLLWYAQFAQRDSPPDVTGTGKVIRYRIRGFGTNPFVA